MRRTRGLSTRLVLAIGLLAGLHLLVFVVLLTTLHDLSAKDHHARTVAQVVMASNDSRIALARGDAAGMRAGAAALVLAGRTAGVTAANPLARDLRAQAATARPRR
ncbi:MAG: hypothetical protein ACJ76L_13450, partial [Conexibacter sp.]